LFGLVFVYDMTDSKFSNFDYELSAKILDLLKVSTLTASKVSISQMIVSSLLLVFSLALQFLLSFDRKSLPYWSYILQYSLY